MRNLTTILLLLVSILCKCQKVVVNKTGSYDKVKVNKPGAPPNVNITGITLTYTQIVFEGNSLTSLNAGMSLSDTWPDKVRLMLPGTYRDFFNASESGNTVAQMVTQGGSEIDSRFEPNYQRHFALLWGGINDLYNGGSGGVAASTVQVRLTSWHAARQSEGWQTIAFTITATQNPLYPELHTEIETERQALNTWIRANWSSTLGASALVDLADDDRIGDYADVLNTTYYQSDAIHMNDTGREVVAELAYDQIITIE